MLECLSRPVTNFLDLGSGDGRLLTLLALVHAQARAVAIDFSETMIDRFQTRFGSTPLASVVLHDLNLTLPQADGLFDAVVSSFAIHHLVHPRKRSLHAEVFDIPVDEEDPSNKLLDVETQLSWLREIGFIDVDCHWKWRELALPVGIKPSSQAAG